ncbi:hypothetical protein JXJ21_02490 [candidate division KSB1 bacterium]|nr:hypothetical protein [candidate division KSB1 bacterium]
MRKAIEIYPTIRLLFIKIAMFARRYASRNSEERKEVAQKRFQIEIYY